MQINLDLWKEFFVISDLSNTYVPKCYAIKVLRFLIMCLGVCKYIYIYIYSCSSRYKTEDRDLVSFFERKIKRTNTNWKNHSFSG